MTGLEQLQQRVVACRRCPRLVRYIGGIRRDHPDYWCRPVPSFGDPAARMLLVGLAPGQAGSNRTGRMFTGDASGSFLYKALHTLGWANQPEAWGRDDGLRLRGVYITAVVRCAPPQNKPAPEEIGRCAPFVGEELELLRRVRVVVTFGQIAHQTYLRLRGARLSEYPFRHGAAYRLWCRALGGYRSSGSPQGDFREERQPEHLVASYHPSRQNTNTGVLTMPMFLAMFRTAARLADLPVGT